VKRFINIDSIGGVGKALMVRTKPYSFIEDYSTVVPHPHTNVLATELTQFVANENDYSVYVNNTNGYDFSFYGYNYKHHTVIDDYEHIDKREIQSIG